MLRKSLTGLVALTLVTVGQLVSAAAASPPGQPDGSSASVPAALAAAPAPESVRIAAAGDIACQPPYTPRRTTCRHAATAKLIRDRGARAVLELGDTQYETGALSDFRESYDPTWGTLRAVSRPVPGNHEYATAGATGYFSYFGDRAHGPRGCYAYDLGQWRLYALNSNCGQVSCDAQTEWLRNDLRAHPSRCALAYMHHPRFSSGPHGNSVEAARLWPTLDRWQVDVALAGHDHDYERFAPMTAGGDLSAAGIRSFVVGTGGKSLSRFAGTHEGSRARQNDLAGVLFMTLHPTSYEWTFRKVDGTAGDSGTGSCVA